MFRDIISTGICTLENEKIHIAISCKKTMPWMLNVDTHSTVHLWIHIQNVFPKNMHVCVYFTYHQLLNTTVSPSIFSYYKYMCYVRPFPGEKYEFPWSQHLGRLLVWSLMVPTDSGGDLSYKFSESSLRNSCTFLILASIG